MLHGVALAHCQAEIEHRLDLDVFRGRLVTERAPAPYCENKDTPPHHYLLLPPRYTIVGIFHGGRIRAKGPPA